MQNIIKGIQSGFWILSKSLKIYDNIKQGLSISESGRRGE
jgi:hypothetical protein